MRFYYPLSIATAATLVTQRFVSSALFTVDTVHRIHCKFGGTVFDLSYCLWIGCRYRVLLLCAVSKLLELHTRRDGYVVLSLSLFVLAGLLLINQDLMTTLQVAIGTMVVLFAMIAQNDDGTGRYRTLGLLVGQAIPLTIILFLFFPDCRRYGRCI